MKWIAVAFSLCFLVGCATINSLQPGGGTSFDVSGRSYDDIWKAVVRTASRSLTIVENNKESGILKAEKSAGMTTMGEVVGIFVYPSKLQPDSYTIEVQSLKRSQFQITGQDWRATMISGIKTELDL